MWYKCVFKDCDLVLGRTCNPQFLDSNPSYGIHYLLDQCSDRKRNRYIYTVPPGPVFRQKEEQVYIQYLLDQCSDRKRNRYIYDTSWTSVAETVCPSTCSWTGIPSGFTSE